MPLGQDISLVITCRVVLIKLVNYFHCLSCCWLILLRLWTNFKTEVQQEHPNFPLAIPLVLPTVPMHTAYLFNFMSCIIRQLHGVCFSSSHSCFVIIFFSCFELFIKDSHSLFFIGTNRLLNAFICSLMPI